MSISNCGHDENNKYSGGTAGDQTGTEWAIINWYNRPWKCVLRHPDAKVRAKIAELAKAAANNNKIGYDQSQRGTFWTQLQKANYNPANITTACEADCSSGVSAIVKAVGYLLNITLLKNVNASLTTSGMRAAFKNAGFTVLTDSKYLTSDAYLLEGDILLNDGAHTATNLTNGSMATASDGTKVDIKVDAAQKFDKSLAGKYKVTASDFLALRAGAGTSKTELARMKTNETVQCYGYYTSVSGTKWLYIVYNGITGFASSAYLKKQ
ncbi:MAG: SH3 domain-containing protein [Eubacteriales bacterium]|nr:SH3 domain-containing protein [Eubacteriales bacterium]